MTIEQRDSDAEAAINIMIASIVGMALIPAHVNWALAASAMGIGVVAIGKCYGIKLDKDEAWKLIKQFFYAAGFGFLAINISSKIIAMILSSTGIGHIGAVALDGIASGAMAYAIGGAAKAYFRNEFLGKGKMSNEELGKIVREKFKAKKEELKNKQK